MKTIEALESYVADVLGGRSCDRDELDTAIKAARLLLESPAYLSACQVGAAQEAPPQDTKGDLRQVIRDEVLNIFSEINKLGAM